MPTITSGAQTETGREPGRTTRGASRVLVCLFALTPPRGVGADKAAEHDRTSSTLTRAWHSVHLCLRNRRLLTRASMRASAARVRSLEQTARVRPCAPTLL